MQKVNAVMSQMLQTSSSTNTNFAQNCNSTRNMEKRKIKKEAIQWILLIMIVGVLWATGWHKPLIAAAQQAILSTGIIQPDVSDLKNDVSAAGVDMHLIDEFGNRSQLSDFRGNAIFLNFWATWCPPCLAEMPGIERLYQKVKDNRIDFVMISTDDDFQKAIDFRKRKKYSFPIYRIAEPVPAELQSDALPTTFVLDGDGRVLMKHSGMAEYDTAKFIKFLKVVTTQK